MKKRIFKIGALSVALLTVSAMLTAATPELEEAESLRPVVMHAALVIPSKVERRQPVQDDGLPEPGGWAVLLAGLVGVLAIARRRVS